MMSKRKIPVWIAYSLLLVNLAFFFACAKPEEATTKEPPISEEIKPPAELPVVDETVKLPEPQNAEIQDKIKRLYKDSLIVDGTQVIAGDFNGDTYQDI